MGRHGSPGRLDDPDGAAGRSDVGTHLRDTVVVGASAGGVEALATLMHGLPGDFPAAVLVVLHVMPGGHSMLPQILARSGPLPAGPAVDGEPIAGGRIFVAPPDHHLLVNDGALRVVIGPRENGHRPAIDPLFRSAARARGARVIGVILSGLLDDGAAGLGCVKELGGATVVQDPDDAMFAAMPRAAMAATVVDRITPADQIPSVLQELVRERVAWSPPVPEPGPDQVERDPSDLALVSGEPSPLTCPACGGALWEAANGQVLRFVCQVGHAYSADSMLVEQGAAVESAMWSALRTLEERGELLARIAHRQRGSSRIRFEQRAAEAQEHARRIREVLVAHGVHTAPATDGEQTAGETK